MTSTTTVVGAGTMGNGIAHVFALAGFRVHLVDTSESQLEQARKTIRMNLDRQEAKGLLTAEQKFAALANLHCLVSLEQGLKGSGLVVEATTENTALKLEIFRQLDALAAPEAILATNTSSISITKIAAVTKRPGKVIGMHFMNPVPVMKLVEIINGYATEKSVTDKIVDLSRQLNKVPCVVNDYPGFIANRILMPMINEAITSLHEGVAGVREIDTIMKLGMAHPMGPLELADFIGLDVCHAILEVMYDGLGKIHHKPCPLLTNMVLSGNLGRKTGEGFYVYRGDSEPEVSSRFGG